MTISNAKVSAGMIVDFLTRTEARLLSLAGKISEEGAVRDVAGLLRDLSDLRMSVEAPGAMDKRLSVRVHERAMAYVTRADGRRLDAALLDISTGGALVECDGEVTTGQRCALLIPGMQDAIPAVARRDADGLTHLVFDRLAAEQLMNLTKHIERFFLRY